jgi:protein-S-isoprenylcysteine O-methyltransferase Ste14
MNLIVEIAARATVVLGLAWLVGYATPLLAPTVLWAVLNYVFIPHEERTMSERFGELYCGYLRAGPRRWI